jgi:hypothetical protein
VLAQHLGDRADALGNDAGVAVVAGRRFGDDARARNVVISSGEQRGPRRRAERRGVKAGVLQAVCRDAIERGSRNQPAERAELPVPGVVDQDEHDVRRPFRRPRGLRKLRRIAFLDRPTDAAGEPEILKRETDGGSRGNRFDSLRSALFRLTEGVVARKTATDAEHVRRE